MNRQNKKENIARLHKETIIEAAKKIFLEKGFSAATIEDISKASEYSRRTLYTYFNNKEDILYNIVLNGLVALKHGINETVAENSTFLDRYFGICFAMKEYFLNYPQSFQSVNKMDIKKIDFNSIPPAAKKIFLLGEEINGALGDFIESGKRCGAVRQDIQTEKTVYILWSNLSSLFTLVKNKGMFIEKEFSTTEEKFLEYGFKQIINSILEERI